MPDTPFDYPALDRVTHIDPAAYRLIERQTVSHRQRKTTRGAIGIAAVSAIVIGIGAATVSGMTSDNGDNPLIADSSSPRSDLDITEWQASIADYKSRLVHAAQGEQAYSGARLDTDNRELVLYGTGPLPESLREIVDASPAQLSVRWETVDYNAADYKDAAHRLRLEIPELTGMEWNGWGPIVLIMDPADRPLKERVLSRAKVLTTIPVEIRFQKPAVAG